MADQIKNENAGAVAGNPAETKPVDNKPTNTSPAEDAAAERKKAAQALADKMMANERKPSLSRGRKRAPLGSGINRGDGTSSRKLPTFAGESTTRHNGGGSYGEGDVAPGTMYFGGMMSADVSSFKQTVEGTGTPIAPIPATPALPSNQGFIYPDFDDNKKIDLEPELQKYEKRASLKQTARDAEAVKQQKKIELAERDDIEIDPGIDEANQLMEFYKADKADRRARRLNPVTPMPEEEWVDPGIDEANDLIAFYEAHKAEQARMKEVGKIVHAKYEETNTLAVESATTERPARAHKSVPVDNYTPDAENGREIIEEFKDAAPATASSNTVTNHSDVITNADMDDIRAFEDFIAETEKIAMHAPAAATEGVVETVEELVKQADKATYTAARETVDSATDYVEATAPKQSVAPVVNASVEMAKEMTEFAELMAEEEKAVHSAPAIAPSVNEYADTPLYTESASAPAVTPCRYPESQHPFPYMCRFPR